jgi:hypothetical protein
MDLLNVFFVESCCLVKGVEMVERAGPGSIEKKTLI